MTNTEPQTETKQEQKVPETKLTYREMLKEEALGITQLFEKLKVTDYEGNEMNLVKAFANDLQKMVQLLQKNNSDGEMTIKIKFSNSDNKRLKITPDLKSKFPKIKKLTETFYGEHGYVLIDSPDQLKLDFNGQSNVRPINS